MNAHACCGHKAAAARRGLWRSASGGVISGVLLVLIPKCPMCIAAYVALIGGVGVSVSTAAYLREAMIVLCVGAMVLLAGWYMQRALLAKHRTARKDGAPGEILTFETHISSRCGSSTSFFIP
ncbi:hypothetical protein [Acidobacterium sp. S8]|uniref:hypothetical protein n=1 Tax=Acidobacterium sp. S8 TaxID=1641854 RepID=UPI00131E210A|nr:hypothetical protein [Acidobacterium sp. S8]